MEVVSNITIRSLDMNSFFATSKNLNT